MSSTESSDIEEHGKDEWPSPSDDSDSRPISLEELLKIKKTVSSDKNIDEDRLAVTEQTIKERETVRVGQEKYFGLRDRWSWFIFAFVTFMLIFQLFITLAVGLSWLDFSDDRTFLTIIIGENFAQIIGMGYIVAKYLFPNKK